jgi:lipopolysaccharide/colanic/teichoic acid biosynthesis glycosyltransferase
VNGRSDIPFLSDEAKKLQLYYAQNISFMLDLKILLKTFKVVICGKGAR